MFVLAASNIPWELDIALLRRLEKRVLVPLPDGPARQIMVEKLLGDKLDGGQGAPRQAGASPVKGRDVDFAMMAERTEGFSGSDIKQLCKEMAMKPVNDKFYVLYML